MMLTSWMGWLLGVAALGVVGSTYPYLATAIAYRQRDNGLAYIMLIMGVGVWNGMFAAQLADPRPIVKSFFFTLSMVGALLAGVGWLLFATTASSTPSLPRESLLHRGIALIVGLDITLLVMAVSHSLYWDIPEAGASGSVFATISPNSGYWVHTLILGGLFVGGALLFADAWHADIDVSYTRGYTLTGIATAIAVIASNLLVPGGLSVAPLVAGSLTTIGWTQAHLGHSQPRLRSYLPDIRFQK